MKTLQMVKHSLKFKPFLACLKQWTFSLHLLKFYELYSISHILWILFFNVFPFFFNFQHFLDFFFLSIDYFVHISHEISLGHKYPKYSNLHLLRNWRPEFSCPLTFLKFPKMYHTNWFIYPSWEDEDLMMVLSSYKDI